MFSEYYPTPQNRTVNDPLGDTILNGWFFNPVQPIRESYADIKAVLALMGHASIQQTAEYAENNPVRLKTIIASVYWRDKGH